MNTNGTSKIESDDFSRVVLWHLCNIQQSLSSLESEMIRRAGEEQGTSPADILQATHKHGVQHRKVVEVLYSNALKAAKIKPSPTFPARGGT